MKDKIITFFKNPYSYFLLLIIIWFFGMWLWQVPQQDFVFPSSDDLAFHIRIANNIEQGDFERIPGQIYFPGYSYLMVGAKSLLGLEYTTTSVAFSYFLFPLLCTLALLLLVKLCGKKYALWLSPLLVWFMSLQILNIWGGHFPYLLSSCLVLLAILLIEKKWLSGVILIISILFHPLIFLFGLGMFAAYWLFFERNFKSFLARFALPFIVTLPFLYNFYLEIIRFLGIKLGIVKETQEFSESSDLGKMTDIVPLKKYTAHLTAVWPWSWLAVGYLFCRRKLADKKIQVILAVWFLVALIFSQIPLVVPERIVRDLVIPGAILAIWMLSEILVKRLKTPKIILLAIFALLVIFVTQTTQDDIVWATTPYISQGEVQSIQWLAKQAAPTDVIVTDITGRWLEAYSSATIIVLSPIESEEKFQDIEYLKSVSADFVYLGKRMSYWEAPGYVYTPRKYLEHDFYKNILDNTDIQVYQVNLD